MKWLLALAVVLVVLYFRRDRRTPQERLRAAYLEGDREYLEANLPMPSDADFNAERWAWSFAEQNEDRLEDDLEPLDDDVEFRKAWFQARVDAYRKANPDLPWRSF